MLTSTTGAKYTTGAKQIVDLHFIVQCPGPAHLLSLKMTRMQLRLH